MAETRNQRNDEAQAFVVWLGRGVPNAELRGTVEHVESATRTDFDDAEGLLRFLRERLRADERDR